MEIPELIMILNFVQRLSTTSMVLQSLSSDLKIFA